MSFVKNDNQQLTVLDSTFNLTEREKRMLEKSKILQTKFFLLLMKIFFLFFTVKKHPDLILRSM